VSLSNGPVQKLLAREFVSAWVNTEGDAAAGASYAHAPSDAPGSCIRGNGRANLQILALTPDGRIFHAMAGYVSPTDLSAELKWALATWKQMQTTPTLQSAMVAERARDYQTSGPKPTPRERLVGGSEGRDVFQDHIERGVTRDATFVEQHPLMPIADFRTSMLGRGGATFFGASRGTQPGETIGNVDRKTGSALGLTSDEVQKLIERMRRDSGDDDSTPPARND
jgi:hypothetical protein